MTGGFFVDFAKKAFKAVREQTVADRLFPVLDQQAQCFEWIARRQVAGLVDIVDASQLRNCAGSTFASLKTLVSGDSSVGATVAGDGVRACSPARAARRDCTECRLDGEPTTSRCTVPARCACRATVRIVRTAVHRLNGRLKARLADVPREVAWVSATKVATAGRRGRFPSRVVPSCR